MAAFDEHVGGDRDPAVRSCHDRGVVPRPHQSRGGLPPTGDRPGDRGELPHLATVGSRPGLLDEPIGSDTVTGASFSIGCGRAEYMPC